jgi:hypothetical protein
MVTPKYHNIKTVIDGIKFDSVKESKRYAYLNLLKRAGEIKSVEHHKKYVLLESFTNAQGIHRSPISYTPDFVVTRNDGTIYAEDIKGAEEIITDLFSIKRKLFEKRYPEIELKVYIYKNKQWVKLTKKKRGV